MSHDTKETTNHETIKRWTEERNGKPARVSSTETGDKPGEAGVLRIDFPGYTGGETLEPLDWHTFFETFDQQRLKFVYQEETKSGETSRFNQFANRS